MEPSNQSSKVWGATAEHGGLPPYTVCVIGRGDVGRLDVEEWDVSHWFEQVDVFTNPTSSLVTMHATMDKSAPVDPLRHVLRVRVGTATSDFVIVLPEWGSGKQTLYMVCFEAKEYWRRQMDLGA